MVDQRGLTSSPTHTVSPGPRLLAANSLPLPGRLLTALCLERLSACAGSLGPHCSSISSSLGMQRLQKLWEFHTSFHLSVQQQRNTTHAASLFTPAPVWWFPTVGMAAKRMTNPVRGGTESLGRQLVGWATMLKFRQQSF